MTDERVGIKRVGVVVEMHDGQSFLMFADGDEVRDAKIEVTTDREYDEDFFRNKVRISRQSHTLELSELKGYKLAVPREHTPELGANVLLALDRIQDSTESKM